MNCKNFQVWAGNAARAKGERHAGHRTGKQLLSSSVATWTPPPQDASLKGGTRGKRARLALKGPFRACCPMASFAYFPSLESRPPEAVPPQVLSKLALFPSSAPFGGTFPPGEGFFSTKSPYNVENQPGTNCSRLALLCISDYSSSNLSTATAA